YPRRVQGRHHPLAGHAEVLLMSTATPHATRDAAKPSADQDIPSFEAYGDGDWSSIAEEAARRGEARIVVNMEQQHPSTPAVLRRLLEIDGEPVTEDRAGIGYLHPGIEQSVEFRTWTQGVTYCTRMDYLAPFFQEVAFCLGV